MISEMSKAAGGPGLSVGGYASEYCGHECMFGLSSEDFLTEDVDVDGGGGSTAAVGGLNDVGGTIVSLGLCNGDSGMSRFSVDGDSVIWFEDQIGFCPLHPRFRFTHHLCRKLDLAAGFGRQSRQQFGIQLNLWRLYTHDKRELSI